MEKMLDPSFHDYSCNQTEKHKTFEPMQFSILTECKLIPVPVKLFDIMLCRTNTNVITSCETALKVVHIQNIRQALTSRLSWSPMKETMTDEISNFQSSNLFHLMNKFGITFSYLKDEKHHTEAKTNLDKDRSGILLQMSTNCHLHQIDNLEIGMQCVMMLSTNEKLLHFMTQQLAYIKDYFPTLDFSVGNLLI